MIPGHPALPASTPRLAIIGGGPAGLMAAEAAACSGVPLIIDLYDAMPSVGRKFLLAGKGGLNLTHSEDFELFLSRYAHSRERLAPLLADFGPQALRDWAQGLGIETFVGSSGRVFPKEMKAAPLLRAWLQRLRGLGVRFHVRHAWRGWSDAGELEFDGPGGVKAAAADAIVLALGGASWPQLGSDGRWWPRLQALGVALSPLRPANCGFEVPWTASFADRYAGTPVKSVAITYRVEQESLTRRGEFLISGYGVEGSLIYALSAMLRDEIEAHGHAQIWLDLAPNRSQERLMAEISRPRGKRSWSYHLQRCAGLEPVKIGLLHDFVNRTDFIDAAKLAAAIKSLPVRLQAPRPLAEAISSAGGVRWETLGEDLQLEVLAGVFCAGEMLDWEAPTGGYLLTACMATGRAAGIGAARWLSKLKT